MSAAYDIVRIALLVFAGILFVLGVVEFIDLLIDKSNDVAILVSTIMMALLQFGGAYASYYHIRKYLYLYALVLLVMIIVALTSNTVLYYHLGSAAAICLIVLALAQAELIKRGHY